VDAKALDTLLAVTPTQVVVLRPPAVSGYPQARSGATGRG